MQIVLATTNPHKLEEIRSVFDAEIADGAITWTLLDAIKNEFDDGITDPVEDQDTFEGNAALKARHYAKFTDLICLADDSGIQVDALGGAPGVISARYSGVRGPRTKVDPANNAKLMQELQGLPADQRTARYVCAMCLVIPAPQLDAHPDYKKLARPGDDFVQLMVRGTLEGRILLPMEADDERFPERGRGEGGFGYDPLFVLPGDSDFAGMTAAQLTPDMKNAISHRGDAARRLLGEMQSVHLI